GFHDREGDGGEPWRWMGAAGSWVVMNTSPRTVTAEVQIDLAAFPRERHLAIALDDRALDDVLDVGPERSVRTIGPLRLTPGEHRLNFRSVEPSLLADAEMHN